MTKENIEFLQQSVQKILKEHPFLFQDIDSDHWYLKRKNFLRKNEDFLELLKKEIHSNEFLLDDLQWMQKLYLLYPKEYPVELLSLPWDIIKILLNIYEEEKRKFYTDLCYYRGLEKSTLISYLLQDFYEKVLAILMEVQDYKEISKEDFLDKVEEVSFFIWSSI